jgi:hypothetical protein
MKKGEKGLSANQKFLLMMGLMAACIIVFALIKIFLLKYTAPLAAEPENVRSAQVAGQFYPAQAGNLQIMVDSFLDSAEDKKLGEIKALVVPHAGYIYSGVVAGEGFRQLESQKGEIKKVFIIASNHVNGAWFNGIAVPNYTHFETPLGKVKVSNLTKQLDAPPFVLNDISHSSHVVEVELPFLQRELGGGFEIIPLMTGGMDQASVNDAAKAITALLDDSSLVVISSDLSHYHPYDEAVGLDTSCIAQVENQSFMGVVECEACGRDAILILLRISELRGWKAKIIGYKNSGDTAGDKSGVVGYSAIAFYAGHEQFKAEVVDSDEQKFLLGLARSTVEMYVRDRKTPEIDESELTPTMKEVRGCFVTLNEHGFLRGCIGHIIPQKQLYECVIENAVSAATADPRFPPVSEAELKDIDIEISVLTLPQELGYSSVDDLFAKLRPGIDGVVMRSGFRSSTFLPQVWEMFGNDRTAFLEALCEKQGSASDCWKNAGYSVYQAQVFGE